MIYANKRPERPIWPRLAPWQDAPDPILYALREKLAKDCHESRRVFQRKGGIILFDIRRNDVILLPVGIIFTKTKGLAMEKKQITGVALIGLLLAAFLA